MRHLVPSSIPEQTLRHLYTQQVAEFDLRYVVGDVFLFRLCQFSAFGSDRMKGRKR